MIFRCLNRVKQVRLNHTHKIFNNTCPSYLKNNFIKINEHQKHNTRTSLFIITKDYKIGIYCFSVKHAALRRKSKDWVARNQDNVSEWGDMSIRGVLFQ